MIIIRLKGGLGNQMFQYALGRVLAIKNNTELVFNIESYEDTSKRIFKNNYVNRTYDLEVFNIKGRIAKPEEIPFLYRMYFKGKFMVLIDAIRRRIFMHKALEISFKKFNPKILQLGKDAYLDGQFQSYKYFTGYEDIIRKDFTFINILKNIEDLVSEISNINSVSIHVRRGDYIGNNFHDVVNEVYYEKGIAYIESKTKIDKLYVFSDDIEWCKKNLKFNYPVYFVGEDFAGEKDEGHMYLMSKCKHFIIANSSFSWWGAWLAENPDKIVVCPIQWFGDMNIDTSDLIPDNWIRI